MPITYNIETDYLYKQGIEKGRVEGYDLAWREANEWKIQAARKMRAEGLSPEKIANIFDLSVDEVNKLLAGPRK